MNVIEQSRPGMYIVLAMPGECAVGNCGSVELNDASTYDAMIVFASAIEAGCIEAVGPFVTFEDASEATNHLDQGPTFIVRLISFDTEGDGFADSDLSRPSVWWGRYRDVPPRPMGGCDLCSCFIEDRL
jgi:hypothetical protein